MSSKASFEAESKTQNGFSANPFPPPPKKQSNIHNGHMPLRVSQVIQQARCEVDNTAEQVFQQRKPQRREFQPSQFSATQRPTTAPPRMQVPSAPVLSFQMRPTDPSLGPVLPLDDSFSLNTPMDEEEDISWELRQKMMMERSTEAPLSISDFLFPSQGSMSDRAEKQ